MGVSEDSGWGEIRRSAAEATAAAAATAAITAVAAVPRPGQGRGCALRSGGMLVEAELRLLGKLQLQLPWWRRQRPVNIGVGARECVCA